MEHRLPLLLASAITAVISTLAAGETAPSQPTAAEGATVAVAPAGRLRLTISVDWEGRNLLASNLDRIEELRERLPQVPLTHFLCAAYLTKPGIDPANVGASIQRALREGDELGLHIHPWRSLVEAARVTFRREPSYWGEGIRLVEDENGDIGHEVELAAYTEAEIRRIVETSRTLFAGIGIELGTSFRAGGWLASPEVLAAVRSEGFLVDSSATDASWHDELDGLRLRERIASLWEGVTPDTQPYEIATASGDILELVDTGALADYVTATEMILHLRAALARLAAAPEHDVHVHLGFHQETAARCSSRVVTALEAVLADPSARERIVFETASSAAEQVLDAQALAAQAIAALDEGAPDDGADPPDPRTTDPETPKEER